MRLVLDTNVVASALLWGGVPRVLLQSRREQRVMLFTSTQKQGSESTFQAARRECGASLERLLWRE
jgi:predicted nucleic acid-binding protein